ncbi:transcriptional regulator family: Fungal Specific TF [Paecilomyces variotii]|uniref:Putative C6 transcription factor n=1 Tax=Byssochlamys spectabilis TaxID=264951 RepID=A0A443I1R8_BYSSP|nr:putative C6 transcription factor [Paecilomyces variotii]KAJ9216289.1 transcriptional regulator family: Fungal Specific TF [Paecilomyces variotii]KAJ9236829.1 transcriptional regulator family: Fungal Specific TF [Paecilomyces variotii]KAJ9265614.1 transcriptional regulator family: Fungal Specific TF [Paecilomyces variotii]KAJ9290145.1 transcriptional regulator family: Fungal Specific TF [Paecilomyces variotii]KAJ9328493.1 transcriptional regulator family: Fungal Specific TF [Paecilomyces var
MPGDGARAGSGDESSAPTSRTRAGSRGENTQGKSKGKGSGASSVAKRRCVSTACIACRRRKSKCDGNLPSCAACSSVYHTPCIYDPNSDHRRKGVYKKDIDNLRTRNTTLQTLVQAILNYDEEEAFDLVRQIRSCDNLEDVAESIVAREQGLPLGNDDADSAVEEDEIQTDQFEAELAGKMSELMLDGSVKFIGGTSNLIFLPPGSEPEEEFDSALIGTGLQSDFSVTQWTRVTNDEQLIGHLMTMYFTWHYAYFTTLSKELFYRDYVRGRPSQYCSSLLVNAILALGCHFSSWEGAREDPKDSATAGDHFFKEAKRLILEHDEHEKAKLCTVQALALMSVREAGCGREGKGWVYSGMSFRMAYDLGLNVDPTSLGANTLSEEEIDARRITFWGCFLFDKCWSNYLGRQPQLSPSNITVQKFDVFPSEDAETWSPYTDDGPIQDHTQAARTRAVALQISKLCEISSDLLTFFYHPQPLERPPSKQAELKKLSEVHTRLEAWRKNVPKEMDPKEGQLPQVLLMHMFYQLLFIHLYRPFLKYTKSTSPLPQHVSPRKLCTQAAATISKLLRVYKRSYGFRQICNIAVYIAHSACTIHLLNLPEKNARRDIIHGLRNLEEIAESWLCARRTLRILDISATKWRIDLPPEAVTVFERTRSKWRSWGSWDHGSSPASSGESPAINTSSLSSTMPSSVSTPGRLPQPVRHELQTQPTASANFSVPQSQPNFFSNTARLCTARQNHDSFSGRIQQPQSIAPEPTYLGPTSQSAYPAQTASQSPQDMWNATQDVCNVSNSSNSPAPIVNTPPMPIFNGVDSLVEESQDWWLRDQSALALGLENWGEGWETADQATAFSMGYNPNTTGPAQTARQENISNAPQQMANNPGLSMPTVPVANQNPYRYMNRPVSRHG